MPMVPCEGCRDCTRCQNERFVCPAVGCCGPAQSCACDLELTLVECWDCNDCPSCDGTRKVEDLES